MNVPVTPPGVLSLGARTGNSLRDFAVTCTGSDSRRFAGFAVRSVPSCALCAFLWPTSFSHKKHKKCGLTANLANQTNEDRKPPTTEARRCLAPPGLGRYNGGGPPSPNTEFLDWPIQEMAIPGNSHCGSAPQRERPPFPPASAVTCRGSG